MLTSPRYSGSLIAAVFSRSVVKIPHAFENHFLGGHKTTCACKSNYEYLDQIIFTRIENWKLLAP